MISFGKESYIIEKEQDVIPFRIRLNEMAIRVSMTLIKKTKLITAASELLRNMLKYANGGKATIEIIGSDREKGIRIIFEDQGPGIPDIDQAMKDGFSTSKGLGLGLPGAKRLVNEFSLTSTVGKGTTVTVIMWKNG